MLNAQTRMFGIFGHPVGHSLSPAIQNAAFEATGLNAVYTAFDVTDLPKALDGAKALGIGGLSITIPHKEAVIPLLDELSPLASMIGSVNTVVFRDGRAIGNNTDAFGAYAAIDGPEPVDGKTVAVFGSGGAARAVLFGLLYYGRPEKVLLVARNADKRREIVSHLEQSFREAGKDIRGIIEDIPPAQWQSRMDFTHVLINTTPLGMAPDTDSSILEEWEIPIGRRVMDIVYKPLKTRFLGYAENRGCAIVYGTEMLLRQGMKQFELWTGEKAPEEAMREALELALRTKE